MRKDVRDDTTFHMEVDRCVKRKHSDADRDPRQDATERRLSRPDVATRFSVWLSLRVLSSLLKDDNESLSKLALISPNRSG